MLSLFRKLDELRASGTAAALVTVVRASGSAPAAAGAKMVVLADGTFFGTIGGGRLEQLALEHARACLASRDNSVFRYPLGAAAAQCCGGCVETFVEVFMAPPELFVFGAGHVAQALCRVLAGTPFLTHVIDERQEWLGALPSEVLRHEEPWDAFVARASFDAEQTYVAVMTHRHDLDQEIVEDVLRRPTRYLGLIGSRTKWSRFRERLASRGLADETLAHVRCPIGLPIGGKTPAEIAVSIAAELLSTHHRPSLTR